MGLLVGERDYGKVDRIPGIGYVVTRFLHFNFLPIAPIRSFFVLEGTESGESFHGKIIHFSIRSAMAGYLRLWGGLMVMVHIVVNELTWFQKAGQLGLGVAVQTLALAIIASGFAAIFLRGIKGVVAIGVTFLAGAVLHWGIAGAKGQGFEDIVIAANPALLVVGVTRFFDNASTARRRELLRELGMEITVESGVQEPVGEGEDPKRSWN